MFRNVNLQYQFITSLLQYTIYITQLMHVFNMFKWSIILNCIRLRNRLRYFWLKIGDFENVFGSPRTHPRQFFGTFKWSILHFKAIDAKMGWKVYLYMLHIIMKKAQASLIENLGLMEMFLGIYDYIRGNLPFFTHWNDQFSILVDLKLGYMVFLRMRKINNRLGHFWLKIFVRGNVFGYPWIHSRQFTVFRSLNSHFMKTTLMKK